MKNSKATDKVDPDIIDSYFEAIEHYSEAIAAADSLAYAARTDYASQQMQSRDLNKRYPRATIFDLSCESIKRIFVIS